MKLTRFLPLALTVLLAACGGGAPTPTPTPTPVPTPIAPTPTPVPTPVPTPPVTPPTVPPTTPDVPYYGEWGWSFDGSGDNDYLHDEGRYSVVETRDIDLAGTGFGYYQICYAGNCYDQVEGGVIMGPGEDNTLTVTLFGVDSAGDFRLVYDAVDDDGALEKDDQGRDVFEGRATYYDPFGIYDPRRGTFRAVLTTLPVTFPLSN